MLKISYADCFDLCLAILAQFTLEMCVAARYRKKFTKTPYCGGSIGHSRLSLLTFLRSSLPVLMLACLCNHFHV